MSTPSKSLNTATGVTPEVARGVSTVTSPTATNAAMKIHEENQYLQLKLKYALSIGTIYRQKIGLLLREAGSVTGADGERLESVVQDVLEDITSIDVAPIEASQPGALPMDLTGASPQPTAPNKERSPSVTSGMQFTEGKSEKAEYWRDQFLSLMHDAQPTSLKDAQALCTILQEKNSLAIQEASTKSALKILQQQYATLDAQHTKLLHDKSVSAEDAVKQLYLRKEQDLEEKLVVLGQTSAEAVGLREVANSVEQKNKVLRLRVSQLRKQVQEYQQERTELATRSQTASDDMINQVQKWKAQAALCDAKCRRLEEEAIHLNKTLALKDNSILRLNGKIEALEKEAECALSAGVQNVNKKETAVLRRQIDTFELHIRKLENENSTLHAKINELEESLIVKGEEVHATQLKVSLVEQKAESYATQLRTMEIKASEERSQQLSLEELNSRLMKGVEALSEEVTTRKLSDQIASMNERLDGRLELQKTLIETKQHLEKKQKENEVLLDEINRCNKLGTPPSLNRLDVELNGTEKDDDRSVRRKMTEVVLREVGEWREMRDVPSGRLFYITYSSTGTPFAPKSTRREDPKRRSPVSTPATQSPKPMKNDDDDASLARTKARSATVAPSKAPPPSKKPASPLTAKPAETKPTETPVERAPAQPDKEKPVATPVAEEPKASPTPAANATTAQPSAEPTGPSKEEPKPMMQEGKEDQPAQHTDPSPAVDSTPTAKDKPQEELFTPAGAAASPDSILGVDNERPPSPDSPMQSFILDDKL